MFISNVTNEALAHALRGLDAQRQLHEHNIANIETPGFLAKKADFTTSLRQALENERIEDAAIDVTNSVLPTRLDGNNVRLDDEVTGLTKTQLHQDLVTTALNARYRLLRTSWDR